MSEEILGSGRVIITRNDLQVRIKKPFDLNLPTGPSWQPNRQSSQLIINFYSKRLEYNLGCRYRIVRCDVWSC